MARKITYNSHPPLPLASSCEMHMKQANYLQEPMEVLVFSNSPNQVNLGREQDCRRQTNCEVPLSRDCQGAGLIGKGKEMDSKVQCVVTWPCKLCKTRDMSTAMCV